MTTAEAFSYANAALREFIATWERVQAQIEEKRWDEHFANPKNREKRGF
jgi:hypothetical protein